MRRKPTTEKKVLDPKFKLKIDHRTIVTVRSKEALAMWKEKYPKAQRV